MLQGRVALTSYHTQWSCGHEWAGKRGRFPVPALYIYNYINTLNIFHRAWGTYIVLLLVYTVWSTSTVILRLYNIYIYICILYVNLVFLLLVFLHVRCIPQTGFVTTVLSKCVTHAGFVMVAWTLRGIPFQVGNLSLRPDLWIYIFQPSTSFK